MMMAYGGLAKTVMPGCGLQNLPNMNDAIKTIDIILIDAYNHILKEHT